MSPLSCGFVRVLTGLEKSEIPLSCSFIFLFIHDTNVLDKQGKTDTGLELSGIVAIFPLEIGGILPGILLNIRISRSKGLE